MPNTKCALRDLRVEDCQTCCFSAISRFIDFLMRRHQLKSVSSEIMDNGADGAMLVGDMNVAHFGDVGMPQLVGLLDSETRTEDDSASFTSGVSPWEEREAAL